MTYPLDRGRRGFRSLAQCLSDLTAIASASPPLNQARIWWYDPKIGGQGAVGPLTLAAADRRTTILIDGVERGLVDHEAFRGSWLAVRDGRFLIDIDVGARDKIQLSSPPGPQGPGR